MKRLSLAIVVVAILAVGATAFAYGTGHGRWHGDRHGCGGEAFGPMAGDEGFGRGPGGHPARMARFLDLSQEQKDKMAGLQKKYSGQMKTARDELFQKRLEMRNLYTDPKADEGTILTKQKEIGSLQQKLRDEMVQFGLEQRRILTPEQLKKLADVKSRFDGCGRGRRFG